MKFLISQLRKSAIMSHNAYLPRHELLLKWSIGNDFKNVTIPPKFHRCTITGADAFSWQENDTLYISFRGTKGFKDVITDLQIGFTEIGKDSGIYVHSGFYDQYKSIEESLYKELRNNDIRRVQCMGHSLGGALASISALHMASIKHYPTTLHTFGSPRIGNQAFMIKCENIFDEIIRVTDKQDPVVNQPILPFYYHETSKKIEFNEGGEFIQQDDNIKGLFIWRFIFYMYQLIRNIRMYDHSCKNYITNIEHGIKKLSW